MDNLSYTLRLLCRDDSDGSEKTRDARLSALMAISRQLREEGFRGMNASSLKRKHVDALLKRWKAEGISPDTIKNRLSYLRWWAQKVGKSGTLPADNATLGIVEPRFIVNEGMTLSGLERIQDPHIRLSLALQQAFGLQPEESIKFQPSYADRSDHIALKDTWTKRRRDRTVPLTTPEQRTVLDQVHRLAGAGSLIPVERTYIEQRRRYEGHCKAAGLSPLHGLRYHYAQARYEALTGWKPAAAGGPSRQTLTPPQFDQDATARQTIGRELGDVPSPILSAYLGQ
jgi:hypothetical protein